MIPNFPNLCLKNTFSHCNNILVKIPCKNVRTILYFGACAKFKPKFRPFTPEFSKRKNPLFLNVKLNFWSYDPELSLTFARKAIFYTATSSCKNVQYFFWCMRISHFLRYRFDFIFLASFPSVFFGFLILVPFYSSDSFFWPKMF